ncbi:hypothetical protein ACLKA6_009504 [Drosophila palustris]
MTPTSLSMSTPTLSSLHHQRMSQSQLQLTLQSQSQSQSPSPLTPHSASPSSFFGVSSSPKFPANYERSEKVSKRKVQELSGSLNNKGDKVAVMRHGKWQQFKAIWLLSALVIVSLFASLERRKTRVTPTQTATNESELEMEKLVEKEEEEETKSRGQHFY